MDAKEMQVEKIREILKVMRENNVQGFELGDFKVTFFAHGLGQPQFDEDGEPLSEKDRLNDELGIDYEV